MTASFSFLESASKELSFACVLQINYKTLLASVALSIGVRQVWRVMAPRVLWL